MRSQQTRMLKSMWIVLILAFSLVSMTAVGFGADKKTLEIWIQGVGDERAGQYRALIDAFNAQSDRFALEVKFDHGMPESLILAAAGGVVPDLVIFNQVVALGERGVFMDLSDLAVRHGLSIDEIYPLALEAATYRGRLYGVPFDVGAQAVAYNATLFDEVGVGRPPEDWTVEDFVEIGKKVTADLTGDGVADRWMLSAKEITDYAQPFLHAFGGDWIDSDGRGMLSHPDSIAGIQFYADLVLEHGISPTPDRADWANLAFLNGEVALYWAGTWDINYLNESAPFTWDAIHAPRAKTRGSMSAATFISIPSLSPNVDQAMEFIRWVTSDEGQATWVSISGLMPINREAIDGWLAQLSDYPAHRHVYGSVMEYAKTHSPPVPEWPQIKGVIESNLSSVMWGQQSVGNFAVVVDEAIAGIVGN